LLALDEATAISIVAEEHRITDPEKQRQLFARLED